MSRAERLLRLLDELRRHRRAVRGRDLASRLGVSLRTLYRDIDALRAQGAQIDGGAGVGFALSPGFLLPPLMFSPDEIEALVLGARWVAEHGDGPLRDAATGALARISAVLPPELATGLAETGLMIGPAESDAVLRQRMETLRLALRAETRLRITYADAQDSATVRTIWPLALGFFQKARVVVAWCELRGDFRTFRLDRITSLADTGERTPRRRAILLRQWQDREGIAPA